MRRIVLPTNATYGRNVPVDSDLAHPGARRPRVGSNEVFMWSSIRRRTFSGRPEQTP